MVNETRRRRVFGLLDEQDYEDLEKWAHDEERVLDQMVSYLLRRALAERASAARLPSPEPAAA